MTDEERASFDNLILACKPHHDLIDCIDPDRFPVSLLKEWKMNKEGNQASGLRGLNNLTEDRLAEMLERAIRTSLPRRQITIQIAGAVIQGHYNAVSIPLEAWRESLVMNPQLAGATQAVVITVRNAGDVPASVETFMVDFFVEQNGKEHECSLIGTNDLPLLNPPLPRPLGVGDSAITWLVLVDTFGTFLPLLVSPSEVQFRGAARLGSGDTITTEKYPVRLLPLGD